jgi:hypothetical protein
MQAYLAKKIGIILHDSAPSGGTPSPKASQNLHDMADDLATTSQGAEHGDEQQVQQQQQYSAEPIIEEADDHAGKEGDKGQERRQGPAFKAGTQRDAHEEIN